MSSPRRINSHNKSFVLAPVSASCGFWMIPLLLVLRPKILRNVVVVQVVLLLALIPDNNNNKVYDKDIIQGYTIW